MSVPRKVLNDMGSDAVTVTVEEHNALVGKYNKLAKLVNDIRQAIEDEAAYSDARTTITALVAADADYRTIKMSPKLPKPPKR